MLSNPLLEYFEIKKEISRQEFLDLISKESFSLTLKDSLKEFSNSLNENDIILVGSKTDVCKSCCYLLKRADQIVSLLWLY
jgi:hypothetical protein